MRQIDLQVDGIAALIRPEVAGKLNLNNSQFNEAQSLSGLLRMAKAEHNAARNRLIASLVNTQAGGCIGFNEVKAKVDDPQFRNPGRTIERRGGRKLSNARWRRSNGF